MSVSEDIGSWKQDTHVQQGRYAWAIDVGVQDAGGNALSSTCQCDVGSYCAFTHAALCTADGDDFCDICNGSFFWQSSFHAGGQVGWRA